MPRRDLPEINAGSMADIAFLLLVFFLMVTTIDTESGILRQLPPPVPDDIDVPEVRERNVFQVLVNANNDLLVEGQFMKIYELKDAARTFLIGDGVFDDQPADENLPLRLWVREADIQAQVDQIDQLIASTDNEDKRENLEDAKGLWTRKLLAIEMFGEYKELPGSALISMQNDNNTSYDTYIQVQNELESAVNELRDELCLTHYGVTYDELSKTYDRLKNDEEKSKPYKEQLYAVRAVYPQRISEAEPKNMGQY
jgi:biopolymer transport protein ExbD